MSVYMVFYAKVTDSTRFGEYMAAVQPLMDSYGARRIARGAPPVVIEGEWPWDAAAIFEFANMDVANSFWNSPDYTEVKKLRDGAAEFQGILCPGMPA